MAVTALEIHTARRCSMAAPSGAPAPTKRSRESSASPSTRASPCTRPSPTSRSRRRTPAARWRAGRTSISFAPSTRAPGIAGSSSTCRTAGGRSRSASSIARCAYPIRACPRTSATDFSCAMAIRWRGWAGSPTCRAGTASWRSPSPRPPTARSRSPVSCAVSSGRTRAVDVLPLADRYHIPHPVARLDDPDAELTVREHAGAPAVAIPRRKLALRPPRRRRRRPGSRPRAPRDGLRARQDLRLLLSRRAPAARRARLHRGEGQRCLPALRRRGVGQPLRGIARSRLRLRRVAERALPPPSPLPRARRGRARALRVRRRDPSRGGGAARGVQLPLRAALAQCHRVTRQPLPVRRSAGDRSGHRPARRPPRSRSARARRGRRSSPSIRRRNTGAATPRSSTST